MENLIHETSKSSRESSIKSFDSSQSNLKNKNSELTYNQEKNAIKFVNDNVQDTNAVKNIDSSSKVPHKIIANWRQACDRTKDKTKDLLKRWRTLPEIEAENQKKKSNNSEKCGWSVHVWSAWVDRFSIDSDIAENRNINQLTPIQNYKLSHFFTSLLDHDKDNLICQQDFETLIERLRHFADWSVNSTEFNILREIEKGFIDTFLHDMDNEKLGFQVNDLNYITKEGWLYKWSELIVGSKNLNDFPIWLQFFVKVLFQVINRSGTGHITKHELNCFYSSVLCLDKVNINEILDGAFKAMTSNGDHPLKYHAYKLCFSNYLLGRHPNGPGHHILGAPVSSMSSILFPVDYTALNAQPEDMETYQPDNISCRRSVVV